MRIPEVRNGQQIVGLTLPVPEPWASELRQARIGFGDPCGRTVPCHITIVPPTAVETTSLSHIQRQVAEVAGATSRFAVHLRGTGTFQPVSPVVFVRVVEGIPECEHLETACRRGPLAQTLRFAYQPHVTIAHEVPQAALDQAFEQLAGFEALFEASCVVLHTLGQAGTWRQIGHFAFDS